MIFTNNIINKKNILIFTVTFFIFFWDMFHALNIKFDPRLIIFLPSIYLLKDFLNDIKNKNYTFLYLVITITFIIVSHSLFVDNLINKKFIFSIIFLLQLLGVAYYYNEIILKNKDKIVYNFIFFFFFSILIHYFLNLTSNPEPFSCGALKNIIDGKNSYNSAIFIIHFVSSYSLIFNENSHLAMSGVAVIIYSVFLITQRELNKTKFTILILFIIVCFLKSSATLLVGTAFSLLALIILNFKTLSRNFIIFSAILFSIIVFAFSQDKVCVNKLVLDDHNLKEFQKFNPYSKTSELENLIVRYEEELQSNPENSEEIKIKIKINEYKKRIKEIEKKIDARPKTIGSLSSDVFFHALKVTYHSLLNKPFGRGFQGYELAFNDYNNKNNLHKVYLGVYNSKDASNTFFKILTEFGIFSVLIYLGIFLIFLSKSITIENKVFLIPFIVTQTIRGAGYFNGAFLFILFLLILNHYHMKKEQGNKTNKL